MIFLRGTWVLAKKELKDSFQGSLIYILGGLFSLISGWLFFNYLIASKELTNQSLLQSVLFPIFGNLNFIFIFLAPLITMKVFSEEKKLHTIELLLTSNLKHSQIILGKFLAVAIIVFFLLSLTFVFPIILSFSGYTHWSVVFTSYLGLYLSILCYISVGIFASSLTDNQVVAALMGFCLLLGLMLFVLTANATNNYILGQIFQFVSVPYHFEGFLRGAIRTPSIVYYLSFGGFFLYLTHLSLESRRW